MDFAQTAARAQKFLTAGAATKVVIANNEAGTLVSSCLDQVTDWAAVAKSGEYCAAKVASACGVTPRQLERYFQARHHAAPHHWLRDLRMRQAVELIRDQTPLKVVAIELGYKHPAHFTHDFEA